MSDDKTIGITALAGLYPSVRDLLDRHDQLGDELIDARQERDRLRERMAQIIGAVVPDGTFGTVDVVGMVLAAIAERDRLRAVVATSHQRIVDALLASARTFRETHHAHLTIDANAAGLIADIVLRLLDADADVDVHAVNEAMAARSREQAAIEQLEVVEAERDRLRAAVQTALGIALKHLVDCHEGECEKCETFGEVYPHLGPPLDVSGITGREAHHEPTGSDGDGGDRVSPVGAADRPLRRAVDHAQAPEVGDEPSAGGAADE